MYEIDDPTCPRCGEIASGIAQGVRPDGDHLIGYAMIDWRNEGSGRGLGGITHEPAVCDYEGTTELFWDDFQDVFVEDKILLWCNSCCEGFTSSCRRQGD